MSELPKLCLCDRDRCIGQKSLINGFVCRERQNPTVKLSAFGYTQDELQKAYDQGNNKIAQSVLFTLLDCLKNAG